MNASSKLRVVTDYDKLPESILEQIKLTYPRGYSDYLISFLNKEGKSINGLRFETDEKIYLIRMTETQAENIISDDDDYDDDGNLLDEVKEEYEEKYPDVDFENNLD
ncbi:MAG: hypothetical protein HKN22_07855 [Bacteroidia bacterium]|nr:hypothetical protein [Bacteroidia bacterium]